MSNKLRGKADSRLELPVAKNRRFSFGAWAFTVSFVPLVILNFAATALGENGMDRSSAFVLMAIFWFFGTFAVGLGVLSLLGFGKQENNAGSFLATLAIAIGSMGSILLPSALSDGAARKAKAKEFENIQSLVNNGESQLALAAADAIVQRDDSPKSYLERARVLHRSGDRSGALKDLNYALTKAPNDKDCLWERNGIHMEIGDYKAVLGNTSRLLELTPATGPDGLKARSNLKVIQARALSELGNHELSRDAAMEAAKLDEGSFGAQNLVGVSLIGLGECDAAIPHLEKATAISPDNAAAWSNLGMAHSTLGHTALALEHYKHAVDLDPSLAVVWRNLAILKFPIGQQNLQLGSFEKAIDYFSKMIENDDKNAALLASRGIAYLVSDQLEQAIADLNRSLDIDSRQAILRYFLGLAMAEKKQWKDAISQYDAAVQLNPDFRDTYYQLAIAYVSIGDQKSNAFKPFELARRNLNEFQKRTPQSLWILMEIAEVNHLDGKLDEAIAEISRYLELVPRDETALKKRLDFFFEANRFQDALSDAEALIHINPDDPRKRILLASVLFAMDRYEEAISQTDIIISQHPKDSSAYRIRGNCLYRQRRYDDSLSSFAKALLVEPKDEVSFASRARIFAIQNRYDQCAAEFQKLVDLKPNQLDPQGFLCWALAASKQWENLNDARSSLMSSFGKSPEPAIQILLLRQFLLGSPQDSIDWAEGSRVLKLLSDANPKNLEIAILHGAFQVRSGLFVEAESTFQAVLRQSTAPTEIASAQLWLSQTQAQLGNLAEARTTLESANASVAKYCSLDIAREQAEESMNSNGENNAMDWWERVEIQDWAATTNDVVKQKEGSKKKPNK